MAAVPGRGVGGRGGGGSWQVHAGRRRRAGGEEKKTASGWPVWPLARPCHLEGKSSERARKGQLRNEPVGPVGLFGPVDCTEHVRFAHLWAGSQMEKSSLSIERPNFVQLSVARV